MSRATRSVRTPAPPPACTCTDVIDRPSPLPHTPDRLPQRNHHLEPRQGGPQAARQHVPVAPIVRRRLHGGHPQVGLHCLVQQQGLHTQVAVRSWIRARRCGCVHVHVAVRGARGAEGGRPAGLADQPSLLAAGQRSRMAGGAAPHGLSKPGRALPMPQNRPPSSLQARSRRCEGTLCRPRVITACTACRDQRTSWM